MKNAKEPSRFYPIFVITLCAAFLFYKYIMQVSPSIMVNHLMRAFHVHGLGLGNLAATFFYSYLITQLFVGVLLDTISPRWLTSMALLVAALGTVLFSYADTLLAAIVARMMMGVGAAFATVAYMKFAALWFEPRKFALIAGLLATAAMTGAVAGEAPLAYLVSDLGWRGALYYCGMAGIVLSVAFAFFVRDREAPFYPNKANKRENNLTFKDVREVLNNKDNWLLTFYSGLAFSPVAVFGGLWGTPFLEEAYKISNTMAATCVSFCFVGLAVGGPLLGLLSDKMGRRRPVMIGGVVLSMICMTLVIYYPGLPLWLMAGLLFLFGFGTGSFMLGFAIGKEINKAIVAATVIAMINTGDAILGAITEPFIGKLLDTGWNGIVINEVHYFSVHDFRVALTVLPVYLFVAVVLVLFVKES